MESPTNRHCYTLNTKGSEFGYGPGRKVSETRHTVLGRHTETEQPTTSGLDSGRPTLQHRMIPGQVPARAGKAQVLPQKKTTLVVITWTSYRKEMGTQGVASLDRGIGVGLFPEARRPEEQHHESGIAISLQTARGLRRYRCTPLSGDTRNHATTRILVIDTRLWR